MAAWFKETHLKRRKQKLQIPYGSDSQVILCHFCGVLLVTASHRPAGLQYERGLLPRCVPREAGSLGAILEDQLPHGGDHLGWLLITLGLHSTLLRLHIEVKTRKLSPQRL